MNLFTINLKIIRALNKCDRNDLNAVLDELSTIPHIFTSKKYIWNIIRPRDFYKGIVYWLSTMIKADPSDEVLSLAKHVVRDIMNSTKSEKLKSTLVWSLTKAIPFITVDIISYISEDRLKHIVAKDTIYTDEAIGVLITEIKRLQYEVAMMEEHHVLLTNLIEGV